MSLPPLSASPARRSSARAVRRIGEAVRIAAPFGPIAVLLLSLDPASGPPRLDLPALHMVVVLLAGLGVDRVGLLLRDVGDYIEQRRPDTASEDPS